MFDPVGSLSVNRHRQMKLSFPHHICGTLIITHPHNTPYLLPNTTTPTPLPTIRTPYVTMKKIPGWTFHK